MILVSTGQYDTSTPGDVRTMKKRVHILHKLLDGSVQRMDYSVLSPYLQPKFEFVLKIRLSKEQINIYQHYLDNFSQKKQGKSGKGYLFNDCQVLRLICAHPALLDTHAEREEQRQMDREEENFIDDGENTGDDDSDALMTDGMDVDDNDDDIMEVDGDGDQTKSSKPAAPKSKRVTRSSAKNKDHPDSPEIILPTEKEWYSQYLPSDHLTESLSGKFTLLFHILKMCEKIGDKLVSISFSLVSCLMSDHILL